MYKRQRHFNPSPVTPTSHPRKFNKPTGTLIPMTPPTPQQAPLQPKTPLRRRHQFLTPRRGHAPSSRALLPVARGAHPRLPLLEHGTRAFGQLLLLPVRTRLYREVDARAAEFVPACGQFLLVISGEARADGGALGGGGDCVNGAAEKAVLWTSHQQRGEQSIARHEQKHSPHTPAPDKQHKACCPRPPASHPYTSSPPTTPPDTCASPLPSPDPTQTTSSLIETKPATARPGRDPSFQTSSPDPRATPPSTLCR